jgi:hypothetical protein
VNASSLDRYLLESAGGSSGASTPGSFYAPTGRYSDLARDLRSFQLHDIVTIVVSDRASAVARVCDACQADEWDADMASSTTIARENWNARRQGAGVQA